MAARQRPVLAAGVPVVSCSKGLEQGSLALMPEVLAEALPGAPVAVLSGPSFAREIASDLPCAVALASADGALAGRLAPLIANPNFGVLANADPVGTAIGGLMKNVVAIASGVLAGRKQVFEGAFSAQAVVQLAARLGVAVPISAAVDALLDHGASADDTVSRLTAAFGR